ncbi:hypothetical protein ABRF42_001654 [Salmonella enterica]|uniref:hypothetical protein n=1 Tax=Klebsiella variicola TaxID=244366 RepID=UPI0004A10638|nr:hypothetical protein [Klebsiella variicola]EIP1530383.1 hypothetical protein [Salmonella enterica]EKX8896315.1 hypothetical protein [Enterobacter asburiae]EIS4093667.1 hypothetical protein [Salmonella enterica]EKX8899215.1 hypothetical protein [Enterobacter asburiae]KDL52950.1 hypothetical protein AD94_05019 [Klebsiella variicola]
MREELNRLVKNISFDHNYNKIYICERRKIYLNNMKLIGRSIDVIKRHNCFMSDGDAGFILSVIKLMKSNGIDDVYFEIKNDFVVFFDVPQSCQINEDYFNLSEINSFANKSISRIVKSERFEHTRLVDFLSLYEPKTALYFLQYIRYNRMLSLCEIDNVLYKYILKLDKEIGFSNLNNFRYISNAVRYLFSLTEIEIESKIN